MISSIQYNVRGSELVPSSILTASLSVVNVDKHRLERLLFIEQNYTDIIAAGVMSKIKSEASAKTNEIKETVLRST
jgi:hypothetical protein